MHGIEIGFGFFIHDAGSKSHSLCPTTLFLCTIEAYTLNTNENVCIRSIGDCVRTRHLSKRSNEPERVME